MVKIKKVTRIFWLGDNDQFTVQDQVQPEMMYVYDPDGRGRLLATRLDFNKYPSSRHKLLQYGKKYKFMVYPRWCPAINNGTTDHVANYPDARGKSIWIDTARMSSGMFDLGSSINSMIYYIKGTKNHKLRYKDIVHLVFKIRKNNAQYI